MPVNRDPDTPAPGPQALAMWVVLLYLAYVASDAIGAALLLIFVAFLLAAVLDGPVRWLEKRRFRRSLSVTAIVAAALIAVGLACYLALEPFAEQVAGLIQQGPAYAERIEKRLVRSVAHYPAAADAVEKANLPDALGRAAGWALPHVGRLSMGLVGAVAGTALVLMMALYTLAEPRPLVRGIVMAFPTTCRRRVLRIILRSIQQVQAWARAVSLLMLIVGSVCGVGLWLLGVPSPLLFGVVAGVGEAIPTIGPILSAVPPVLVAYADSPALALKVVVLYLVVQQLEQNLLVPRVMAAALRLHPVSVLFSVVALGTALGPIGILLAVPACAITKVIYTEVRRHQRSPGGVGCTPRRRDTRRASRKEDPR